MRGVKFSVNQWMEFLSVENKIKAYFNNEIDFKNHVITGYEIRTHTIDSIRVVGIKSEEYELYIGKNTCLHLFDSLKDIIWLYVQTLNSLDFLNLFNDLLLKAISSDGDVLTNMKNLLKFDNIAHYGVREILEFYPHLVADNIQLMFFKDLNM